MESQLNNHRNLHRLQHHRMLQAQKKEEAARKAKEEAGEQKTRSIHPNRRLPPVPSNGDDSEDWDIDPPTTSSLPIPQRKPCARLKGTKPKVHGAFETKEHTLRKTVTTRKYRCQMCRKGVNSAKELLDHHIDKHGIVYCPVCQKALTTHCH